MADHAGQGFVEVFSGKEIVVEPDGGVLQQGVFVDEGGDPLGRRAVLFPVTQENMRVKTVADIITQIRIQQGLIQDLPQFFAVSGSGSGVRGQRMEPAADFVEKLFQSVLPKQGQYGDVLSERERQLAAAGVVFGLQEAPGDRDDKEFHPLQAFYQVVRAAFRRPVPDGRVGIDLQDIPDDRLQTVFQIGGMAAQIDFGQAPRGDPAGGAV